MIYAARADVTFEDQSGHLMQTYCGTLIDENGVIGSQFGGLIDPSTQGVLLGTPLLEGIVTSAVYQWNEAPTTPPQTVDPATDDIYVLLGGQVFGPIRP